MYTKKDYRTKITMKMENTPNVMPNPLIVMILLAKNTYTVSTAAADMWNRRHNNNTRILLTRFSTVEKNLEKNDTILDV